MGKNYFNTLPLRRQLQEAGTCRFMDAAEFSNGCEYAKGKKIVIVGCGAQGLNQGLNMRDSGLDVSYTLREGAIAEKRQYLERIDQLIAIVTQARHRANETEVVSINVAKALFDYIHNIENIG